MSVGKLGNTVKRVLQKQKPGSGAALLHTCTPPSEDKLKPFLGRVGNLPISFSHNHEYRLNNKPGYVENYRKEFPGGNDHVRIKDFLGKRTFLDTGPFGIFSKWIVLGLTLYITNEFRKDFVTQKELGETDEQFESHKKVVKACHKAKQGIKPEMFGVENFPDRALPIIEAIEYQARKAEAFHDEMLAEMNHRRASGLGDTMYGLRTKGGYHDQEAEGLKIMVNQPDILGSFEELEKVMGRYKAGLLPENFSHNKAARAVSNDSLVR